MRRIAFLLVGVVALAGVVASMAPLSGQADGEAAPKEGQPQAGAVKSGDDLASKLTRREIQRSPSSIPNREIVQVETLIPAGVESGWHAHPGEEVGYIIAGQVEMMVQGRATVVLHAGDGFLIPPRLLIMRATWPGNRADAVHLYPRDRPAGRDVRGPTRSEVGRSLNTPHRARAFVSLRAGRGTVMFERIQWERRRFLSTAVFAAAAVGLPRSVRQMRTKGSDQARRELVAGLAEAGRRRASERGLCRGWAEQRSTGHSAARLAVRHSHVCGRRASARIGGLQGTRSISAGLRHDAVSLKGDAAEWPAGGDRRRRDRVHGRAPNREGDRRRLRLGRADRQPGGSLRRAGTSMMRRSIVARRPLITRIMSTS